MPINGMAPPTDLLGEDSSRSSASRDEIALSSDDGEKAVFGPRENIFDAFRGETPPIIEDPVDGMMRPADPAPATFALPLSEETMVCLEDARSYLEMFAGEIWPTAIGWKRDDEASPSVKEMYQAEEVWLVSGQVVAMRAPYDAEGGDRERSMWAPGEVKKLHGIMVGKDTRGVWRPVRPARPQCIHFKAQLSPDGQIDYEHGIVEPLSMYCEAMRSVGGAMMSLESENITACNMRQPQDIVSEERLTRRIKRKIEQGRNREMIPFLDMAPPRDWSKDAMDYPAVSVALRVPHSLRQGVPSTVFTYLYIATPSAKPLAPSGSQTAVIVLPDDGWQPDDALYIGEEVCVHGKGESTYDTGSWGLSGSGETLLRLKINEPAFASESDAAMWPDFHDPMLRVAIHRQADFCVAALRKGKCVSIVARTLTHQAAFFAAVVWAKLTRSSGLDSLTHVENEIGAECAPDLAHRVFLRSITETP